ncbi:MAG: DegT/DnrJ/EryC1/StrS family aminotransferase [Desulfobacterales bacterium]|nr:DegT/DnrJ/EryC1/StrS family aminotransferase [Desulfobacterales bacterium]
MRVKRTLPPAAAPIPLNDIFCGIQGLQQGPAAIENFKADIRKKFQVRHCFLVSSGKAALTLILHALHRFSPERDEVLIPAFTCYSVPSAIVRAGLKPRLGDVDPATLDFDFDDLPGRLSPKEKLLAVVSPHLFGLPANIAKMRELLKDSGAVVIEDTAQAMGGEFDGKPLGTLGDIGFFSLGRGKAFSTVEGGLIVTNSDRLAEALQLVIQEFVGQSRFRPVKLAAYALALSGLTNPAFFWLPKSLPGLKLGETIYDPGFPIKAYSPFQAGLARNWKRRIASFQSVRRENVRYWTKTLGRFPWLEPVSGASQHSERPLPLLRLPVRVKNSRLRDAVLDVSERRGLGIMPSYPAPVDEIKELGLSNKGEVFPGARQCAACLLTFPVHGFVSPDDRRRITAGLETVRSADSVPVSA